jgi:hypothetical protein
LIFLSLFWPSLISRWGIHFRPFHDVSLCLALSKNLTQSHSAKNADAVSRRKIGAIYSNTHHGFGSNARDLLLVADALIFQNGLISMIVIGN